LIARARPGRARDDPDAESSWITHRSTSPITKASDIRLYTAAKQTAFRNDTSSSRIAHLTVIDTLYVGVALRGYDRSLERIGKTREATEAQRY
jgi:DNA-binding MurR/RpiR family transcriptional regulator